jgi:coenzyme F420 hydrogenase subunit beta
MKRDFINVGQGAAWRLCIGCGACHFICPENNIKLYDVEQEGIRPFVDRDRCGESRNAACVSTYAPVSKRHMGRGRRAASWQN